MSDWKENRSGTAGQLYQHSFNQYFLVLDHMPSALIKSSQQEMDVLVHRKVLDAKIEYAL